MAMDTVTLDTITMDTVTKDTVATDTSGANRPCQWLLVTVYDKMLDLKVMIIVVLITV